MIVATSVYEWPQKYWDEVGYVPPRFPDPEAEAPVGTAPTDDQGEEDEGG